MPEPIALIPVMGLPRIRKGAALAPRIVDACDAQDVRLQKGDVLVVAQKIVSKAAGRWVDLRKVRPSPFAERYASTYGKDPRLIETVLRETKRVARMDRGVLICETHHGFICANAGVDQSNVERDDHALLLPEDSDRAAAALQEELERLAGCTLSVIVSDTWGRPWRAGLVEFAIGVSGLRPIEDYAGKKDLMGRPLEHTMVAVADELAAAAGLLMRKDAGVPVVIVRGYRYRRNNRTNAQALLRKPGEDLFR